MRAPLDLHEELLHGLRYHARVLVRALQRVALPRLQAPRREYHRALALEQLLDARLYVLEEAPLLVLLGVCEQGPRVQHCREVVPAAVSPADQRVAFCREAPEPGLVFSFGEPEDDAGRRGLGLPMFLGVSFGGGVLLSGHAEVHRACAKASRGRVRWAGRSVCVCGCAWRRTCGPSSSQLR